MFSQNKKKMAIFFGVAIFFVVLDRFLKSLALKLSGGELEILSNWLRFTFVKNYNIALSLPLHRTLIMFLAVILTMLVVYYFLLFLKKEEVISAFCMLLIVLGAISNLVDRILYGFVIDYFDIKFFSVLNFADVMISTGVLIFAIYSFWKNARKPL